MTAYYNEHDPKAAAWLRELIRCGHIAPGDVDERDIRDVNPDELRAYDQCHFFAGIGGWSLALRRAGWPDDRPVWTGSCPCQPFSAAGKRGGTSDERHLWPHWFHLIDQCRPPVVFGEQVASKDGLGWFDLVSADLEGSGYAVGAADLCAAGVGAPHIRQRLWFVGLADAEHPLGRSLGQHREDGRHGPDGGRQEAHGFAGARGEVRGLADTAVSGSLPGPLGGVHRGQEGAGPRDAEPERSRSVGGVADADGRDASAEREQRGREQRQQPQDGGTGGLAHPNSREPEQPSRQWARPGEASGGRAHGQPDGRGELAQGQPTPRPVNGFWRDADWLLCRDGKWRPVEPGTFPLAHGVSGRVGLLRGYGNAISPEAAQAFIEAYINTEALDYQTETA